MIAIELRFLSGRFHANPWGRHVNEAAPEWPPSPWRILRALVATWKRKLDHEYATADIEPILRLLAKPPQFALPPAALGHTRHYMPWFKKGADDRTLVFDGFVVVKPSDSVTVVWPDIKVQTDQRQILGRLLDNLGFLGRAESWSDASLLPADAAYDLRTNCVPLNANRREDEYDIVQVLCADPETAFSDEHIALVEERKQGRGKQAVIEKKVHPRYDPNWHLCVETAQLHAERWSDPPGSRWVRYLRRSDCFNVEPPRTSSLPMAAGPQIARFALDSTVLPLVTETLTIAECARTMVMGIYGRITKDGTGVKGKSPTFSGKDSEGRPLSGHEHAYFLPSDEDEDGKLDHLTIITASNKGFGARELKAIDDFSELMSQERRDSGHPLRVVLVGLGRLEEYSPLPVRKSASWESVTPFIATRHLKKRGVKRDPVELWNDHSGFLTTVVREELERWLSRRVGLADFPLEKIKISPIVDPNGAFRFGARQLRPIQFKRFRQKRGDDGGRRLAGAFRLTFPHPVSGPICLGHSAHFGMGLFLAVKEAD